MASMPRLGNKSTHVAVRLDDETVARLDALTARLSPKGMALARSEVIRAALAKGLDVLERREKASK